ncbi:MAG: hypothetical protein Q4F82_02120 [bacterium]|nr:hypothetical protein [bacterium]
MRISIKTKAATLFLGIILALGLNLQAQSSEEQNGIHVHEGSSSSELVSSNIGDTCFATGYSSFAGGYRSYAQGSCSFAFGNRSQALQPNAYVMGNMASANGANSLSLGFYTQANQNGSIVIGSGNSSNAPLTSTVPGIMLGAGSSVPTLFITRANGSLNTGKVGIGNITSPQAKLHIVADEYEDASLFLQPTGKNGEVSVINMTDNNHQILVKEDGSMHMAVFNNALGLMGSNVNLTGNELSLGYNGNRKFYATTQGTPVIYSNAYRTANGCFRFTQGSSYAIEFNGNGLLFRTATFQQPLEPRSSEITNWRDALLLKTNGAITLNGKVGINTENTTSAYALAVDGGLITTKVYVQDVENWSDYVFDDTYKLMPLHELKKYICDNKHLPEIPSESEIVRQGYDLHEMQNAMMKKIEELTLYILQQQEEIETLRKMVDELKGK